MEELITDHQQIKEFMWAHVHKYVPKAVTLNEENYHES